ncbi:MAG: lycopene cyclase domain-containing protein [archaeon]|nr:lycopene cyclase domain-containing protein [archaeon]
MNYQYSYLLGDAVLLIIWFALFFWRKNIRKEMIIISSLFGVAGIIAQFVYTADWWHPLTITNTLVGIEDFIFGFSVGGIASIIYEEVFKKRIRLRKASKKRELQEDKNFFLIGLSLAVIFFISFYFLKINSFYSSILAFAIPLIYMWLKRKDLIYDSLASGFLLMLVSFLAFIIPEFITPGWVQSAWYLENLSGIIILKAPLEDIIWFFLAGAFIGPLYEFWKEGKLVKEK